MDDVIAHHLSMADRDHSGGLNFEEFCKYYSSIVTSKARQQIRAKMGSEIEGDD